MARLEELTLGTQVSGLAPGLVTIRAISWKANKAIDVIFEDEEKNLDRKIVTRDDERRISIEQAGRPSTFTVDTHLFRELGELLVGRESTALVELLKNAYDADATNVVVFGQHLSEPSRGIIRITDNGVGMDLDTFIRGFLRVASRIREAGARKSVRWGRRYTGAKGVGRLAAHKLARHIDIRSTPWTKGERAINGVDGSIDWDEVEKAETLDAVSEIAVTASERAIKKSDSHGTTLTLSRLRQKWTKTQLSRFLTEVEGLRAPVALCEPLARSVVAEPVLFEKPIVVDSSGAEPGFNVELEGEFEGGDSYWPAVLDASNWILEIDASARSVRYAVAPTKKTRTELRKARPITLSEPHPAAERGPFFHARIVIREGMPTGKSDQRGWASRSAGIRVYMEGFRVLPYGEDSDDWLSLGRDTNDRTRKLHFLVESAAAARVQEVDDEGLLLLPSKHYFGGVFLTANRSGTLEMLVNREGFVPDASYELLVQLVRRGIDLATRIRAAAKAAHSDHEIVEPDEPPTPEGLKRGTLKGKVEGSLQRLTAQASELEALANSAPAPLAKKLLAAATEIERAAQLSRELIPANTMVLVLASVGTQLAAFTHEVNRLLSLASDVEAATARLRDHELPPRLRTHVSKVGSAAADLRRAIERQAAYLVDIITPDARRRRSRHRLRETLDLTWRFVASIAEQREIELKNDIDADHRSPPMFRAELMAVLTNLLTNAVKAAGKGGAIRAASAVRDNDLLFRLENTGVEVDLAEAEQWFKPFESTTLDVDPVLGQGMGLGLGITRDLLAEIGASIKFVRPHRSFATAIEIVFPGAAR